jgi:GNAT superfamily N-acetyltransferase
VEVRRVTPDDREWMAEAITGAFASTTIVSRGRVHEHTEQCDGFVVENDGRPIGCALWVEIDGDGELVVLVTTYRGVGAGTVLLETVVDFARKNKWKRLWLTTTNDNTDAIRMYQRDGWDWVDFHRDAVTAAREYKPELPELGNHGIPLRHEIVLEYPL